MAISSVIFILTIAGAVVTAEEKVCSSFCSSLGMLQSSPGKSCAEIYQINKASRRVSGLYWINTTSGLHQVNCDMELECGGHKGGWTTIVKLDASKGDACPSGWTTIATPGAIPKVVCQPSNDSRLSSSDCYSAIFTTYNVTFNKMCGQVKGYQQGNSIAFYSTKYGIKSINNHYVGGLSLTLGNPRKHVWTYAVGMSDDYNNPNSNCPCAAIPGPDPPAFVGDHYYCESGNTGINYYGSNEYYTSDALWDGYGCHHANNNCCTNPDMPWFFRQFSQSTQGDLEARICHRIPFLNGYTVVESIELYIQ